MTKQEEAAAHARMTNELAYLRAFHAAAYALAGPRPRAGLVEPDWSADLFEAERRAVAATGPADQEPRDRNGDDLVEPGDPARWER